MKKIVKKLLVSVLALTVAFTVATPLTAEAAISAPKSKVLYRTEKTGTSYISFNVEGLKKTDTIKSSSVTSSNKKVMTPWYVEKSYSDWGYSQTYMDKTIKPNSYSSSSYSATIGLQVKSTGTSIISYKIGSKKYNTKVTVKAYTNPLKTVQIAGIKNGSSTNLAGKLKNQSYANLKLTKDVKNATIKVEAQKNWAVKSMYVNDGASGNYHSIGNNYGKNVGNVTLHVGALKKNKYSYVGIEMVNTKDGGTIYCNYHINGQSYILT